MPLVLRWWVPAFPLLRPQPHAAEEEPDNMGFPKEPAKQSKKGAGTPASQEAFAMGKGERPPASSIRKHWSQGNPTRPNARLDETEGNRSDSFA